MDTETLYNNVDAYLEVRALEIDAPNPNDYLMQLNPNERFMCQLGHLHGQVYNGGFVQWVDNGYAERDLENLLNMRETLKNLGVWDTVRPFHLLLQKAEQAIMTYNEIREESEPDMWDFEDEDDEEYSEAWREYDYAQDHADDALDTLDTEFYSDEVQGHFATILDALLNSLT